MTRAAGWYPDPEQSDQLRWWDGSSWTAHRAPRPREVAAPSRTGVPRYGRRWVLALAAAAGLAIWGLVASYGSEPTPGPRPNANPTSDARESPKPHASKPTQRPAQSRRVNPHSGTALTTLATLPVKGRAPRTGYDRAEYGQAWLDTDRNGCDTRSDILGRDLTHVTITPGTNGCRIEAGTLADPYTATVIDYVRGNDSVDIDHVVSLSNAWQTGAFRWEIRKRAALANDPMNLLAVDSSANRQKGDADTATWLPSNKRYRCSYAARQVSVKAKYQLWVTVAELDAMARILASCPRQRSWTGGAPTISPVAVNQPRRTTPTPDGRGPVDGSGGVYYENCDAVRADGADPIHSGDPGYGPHLDRDGDGTGCE